METSTPRRDAFAALLLLAICVPFALVLGEIYIDPFDAGFSARDFPVGVLSAIVVLSLVLLIRSIRQMRQAGTPFVDRTVVEEHLKFGLPIVLVGIAYVSLFVMFQYLVPTAIAMSVVLYMFKNRGWVRLGLVPVIASLGFYLLFFGVLSLHEFPGTVVRYDGSQMWRGLMALFGQ